MIHGLLWVCLSLPGMPQEGPSVVTLSGTKFEVRVDNSRWIMHYAGRDPRILSRAQDEELSQERIADLLAGICQAIGTGKADEAAGLTSSDRTNLRQNQAALQALAKQAATPFPPAIAARIASRRTLLDSDSSFSTDRLALIDKEIAELKKLTEEAAKAAAPAPANPAAPVASAPAPPAPPAPPVVPVATVAPVATAPVVTAPVTAPVPANPVPKATAAPIAADPVRTRPSDVTLTIGNLVAPTDKSFGALYEATPVSTTGLDPFLASGTVNLDDSAGPLRALLSHAGADLDTSRAPNEPKWKANVNPFFWIKTLTGSGSAMYSTLAVRRKSGQGFAPALPLAIDPSNAQPGSAQNNAGVAAVFSEKTLVKASKSVGSAVTANPKYGIAVYNQAVLEATQFNLDIAIKLFGRAREAGVPPDYSAAAIQYAAELTKLAALLKQETGSQTRIYREMVDAANVCYNAGLLKESLAYAFQASVIDETRPEPYILAARVCAQLGKSRDAVLWAQHSAEHLHTKTDERVIYKLLRDLSSVPG